MAELKTQQNDADVREFVNSLATSEQKKKDAFALVDLMQEQTGQKPKMWGSSIIGFGSYHYKSSRSTQEGDWFKVGFSPRKSTISLYIYISTPEQNELLKKLGKYKMGKSCIYVNKLEDIDLEVLRKMIDSTTAFLDKKYG